MGRDEIIVHLVQDLWRYECTSIITESAMWSLESFNRGSRFQFKDFCERTDMKWIANTDIFDVTEIRIKIMWNLWKFEQIDYKLIVCDIQDELNGLWDYYKAQNLIQVELNFQVKY